MSDSLREGPDIQETDFGGLAQPTQRRVIHFSSGETMVVEDEEEEEEEEDYDSSSRIAFGEPTDKARLTWRNVIFLVGRKSLQTCDVIGGKLAGLLGLDAAKYQYAIDHYRRDNKMTSSSQGSEEGVCEEGAKQVHLSPRQGTEEGAERVHLSPRQGTEYGATGTMGCPADDGMSPSLQ